MAKDFDFSFSSGEIAPSLRTRVDLELYRRALEKGRNIIISNTGSILSAPGRDFVDEIGELAGRVSPSTYPTGQKRIFPIDNTRFIVIYWYNRDVNYFEVRSFSDGKVIQDSDGNDLVQRIASEITGGNFRFIDDIKPLYIGDNLLILFKDDLGFQTVRRYDLTRAPSSINTSISSRAFEPMQFDPAPRFDLVDRDNVYFSTPPRADRFSVQDVLNGDRILCTGASQPFTGEVEYRVSAVNLDGIESKSINILSGLTLRVASTPGEDDALVGIPNVEYPGTDFSNVKINMPSSDCTIEVRLFLTNEQASNTSHVKFYRRPKGVGAFGFIGVANVITPTSNALRFIYRLRDDGLDADFSNQPVKDLPELTDQISNGVVYQSRLIVYQNDKVFASRTNQFDNFTISTPHIETNALATRLDEGSEVNHGFVTKNGLALFTNKGIYAHTGAVTGESFGFVKRAPFICDPILPPIQAGHDIFFLENRTNIIRNLQWTREGEDFVCHDINLYNIHIFKNKKVIDWTYQHGDDPLIWVTFEDGSGATITYDKYHNLAAWTTQDHRAKVVGFASNLQKSLAFLQDGTDYWIEEILDRKNPVNPILPTRFSTQIVESGLGGSVVDYESHVSGIFKSAMESTITKRQQILYSTKEKVVSGTDTLIRLSNLIFDTGGSVPEVGDKLLFVNKDGYYSRFEVTALTGSQSDLRGTDGTTFYGHADTMSCKFEHGAFDPATDDIENFAGAFLIFTTFDGLEFFDGETVDLIVDGNPVGKREVSGNQIEYEEGGIYFQAGIARVNDIGTLEINSTLEGQDTILDAVNLNEAIVEFGEVFEMYAGNRLPKDDTIGTGNDRMNRIVTRDVSQGVEAYRFVRPERVKQPATLGGDWSERGKLYLRNIDPLHFEILGIYLAPRIERRNINERRGR